MRASIRTLVLFLIMAAVVAFASWARAEPIEPCARAEYLAGEYEDALDVIHELIAQARPVCAERALIRDCARQRIEIRARIAEAKQILVMQLRASRECVAPKRKA